MNNNNFKKWFQEFFASEENRKRWIALLKNYGLKILFTVIFSFVCASLVITFFLPRLVQTAVIKEKIKPSIGELDKNSKINFRDLQKEIIDRKLFGDYPDESDGDEKKSEKSGFDMKSPCNPTTLKLTLLGTIFTGNSKTSFATLKEEGIEQPDIYKINDPIIGQDGVVLAAIGRKQVVLNNNGRKECIVVKEKGEFLKHIEKKPHLKDSHGLAQAKNNAQETTVSTSESSAVLQSSWVEAQLGDGFSKIIQTARLVPNVKEDGSVDGFKVFDIEKDSLFERLGLKENDVIFQVGEAPMDISSGFLLYEKLSNEREVVVRVKRGENLIHTITVQIK